ncbi:5-hydroxytryptamine receptor 3A-like [Protopterus annectens]|uniref:5-hydroxytryptamine receptor 3A-like n=1 Tax=Protopterus annectens TaxID=7888 RepID=UPI001CF9F114|nr:5-hydroxytryptamine receptor 3A-like [Protopterus annectens]
MEQHNLSKEEEKLLFELKTQKYIRIMKPDKGGGVLFDNEEYNNALTNILWDSNTHTSVSYNEKWLDEYLIWNPMDYDGLTHFSLPVSEIWTPDITIQEVVNEVKSGNVPYVSITFLGLVRHYRPLRIVVGCNVAMFRFPFDTQNCNLTFGPWLHTVNDVNVSLERSPEDILRDTHVFVSNGEWELLPVKTWYHVLETEDGQFARLTFQVSIRRHPLFYVVNLIVPSALVMVIDITGFFIPPESAERISFKMTLLFGYTVFLVLVNDILPPFKDATPMMGIYFVVCMAFLVLSVAESVLLFAIVKPTLLQEAPPECILRFVSRLCRSANSETKLIQSKQKEEDNIAKKGEL